jgi:hypothetical protein
VGREQAAMRALMTTACRTPSNSGMPDRKSVWYQKRHILKEACYKTREIKTY